MPTVFYFVPCRNTPTLFNVNEPDTKSITVSWKHEQTETEQRLHEPLEIRRSDKKIPDYLMISYPTEVISPFVIKIRYDPLGNPNRAPQTYTDEFILRFPGIGYGSVRTFLIEVNIIDNVRPGPMIIGDEEENDSDLECGVCRFKYNETDQRPRTMDCGHAFCEKCLIKIKAEADEIGRRFMCPTDRIETKTEVSKLPLSHHLVTLMRKEKAERMEKQKFISKDPIVPCAENPKHEASMYCVQCKATFCESCYTPIHSYKFNAGHKTVPVTEQPIKIPLCSIHPDQHAEFYCPEEKCIVNEFYCRKCSGDHINHRVENIKTRCQENAVRLKGMIEDLHEKHTRLDEIWNDTKTVANTFHKEGSMVQNAVKKIEEHFDKRKREAVFKLEGWAESKRMRIMQKADKIQKDLSVCGDLKKNAEKVYGRKTGLHEDLDSLMIDFDFVKKAGEEPDNLFYFSAYSITNDMSQPPYLAQPFVKKEPKH
ncbi:hypothetical protein CAEBREN_05857 [Caenorhabditis brenneri]|uniref:RING-type domain-containing protein n=1 Tax=Caenorhabditis brenneri TaxID=135651 RepID=G0NC13_CAEBE|nr:hypothetical protein CAEBREN_05857 [Caenorhabditis brenneri]